MNSIKDQINQLRNDYDGDILDVSTVSPNPMEQFEKWMGEALFREVLEPNAIMLATASKTGQPSVRTVLLRDYSERGFVFFTNYNSQKGKDIDDNPKASILFFWPKLMRQLKLEGILEKISPLESEKYFYTRPIGNQIAAWVSPQSVEVESKADLEKKYREFEQKFIGKKIPYPEFWGGYCLKPNLYEFWQGQASRLHDRIQYRFDNTENNWKIIRLAP
jgi:pyridoxamine 5'-phosphate oxidase